MMTKTKKARSGPVYIETERGTVSLVFEGALLDEEGEAPRLVGKPDVYVIDGDGVRLVHRANTVLRALIIGMVAYAVLWIVSMLLRGRRMR